MLQINVVSFLAQNRNFLSGLPYCAPAFELAAEEISGEYGFNATSVVITRPDLFVCDDLISNVNLISDYFYNKRSENTLTAIFPNGEW